MVGIAKHYGGVHALQDVDFACGRHSIHAVLGENGAGKSTLIKIAAGVVRPDAGAMQPVERFVHRCTSVLPLNATPDDRARIAWLVERPGLRREEADLLRHLCSRMAGDEDPERAGFARAAMRSVDELDAGRAADQGAAGGGRDAPATEHEDAYARRDYGEVLRLLHAARDSGDPAIPADLADYWLTG